jgi:hypothetical protein
MVPLLVISTTTFWHSDAVRGAIHPINFGHLLDVGDLTAEATVRKE